MENYYKLLKEYKDFSMNWLPQSRHQFTYIEQRKSTTKSKSSTSKRKHRCTTFRTRLPTRDYRNRERHSMTLNTKLDFRD